MTIYIASRCACCRKTLTDALSIECAMGPVCRKGHGYETQDAPADWGKALGSLGPECPEELYMLVLNAYGKPEEPTLRNARAACNALVRRVSVADQAGDTKKTVARMVLAVQYLGYWRLAAALARGLGHRKDIEGFVNVVYVTQVDGAWSVEMAAKCTARYAMRRLGGSRNEGERAWTLASTVDRVALFNALVESRSIDIVAGGRGISIRSEFLIDADPAREWGFEESREEDRIVWITKEHGEFARYAIPGEPAARPGLEKVPAEFFGHRLTAVSA